jgi:hypothetical protein
VKINQVITLFDDLFSDQERGALSLCAVHLAGIETVHTFAIDRIDVGTFCSKEEY